MSDYENNQELKKQAVILAKVFEKALTDLVSNFKDTKTMKNIAHTSFVSIIYLNMAKSHFKQDSKQLKKLFK